MHLSLAPLSRTLLAALALGLSAPLAMAANGNAAATTQAKTSADIVDTALAAGQFKTLAAALGAAGLVDTLKGTGPFTVFAPTDAAFAALPAGTVEDLLNPENKDKLVSILTYHVVPGTVPAAKVVSMNKATTINGGDLRIATNAGTVKINDATVAKADVMASNGVIHVIDKVLLPSK